MNQIRENIWIGGAGSINDIPWLRSQGVTAILNVAHNVNNVDDQPPDNIRIVKVGLGDYEINKPYMKELAVHALKMMLLNNEKVLVHCAAGASRSVWVVCKALGDLEGVDPKHILEEVQTKRPQASYGPLFV